MDHPYLASTRTHSPATPSGGGQSAYGYIFFVIIPAD